jgi:hypothetical protein
MLRQRILNEEILRLVPLFNPHFAYRKHEHLQKYCHAFSDRRRGIGLSTGFIRSHTITMYTLQLTRLVTGTFNLALCNITYWYIIALYNFKLLYLVSIILFISYTAHLVHTCAVHIRTWSYLNLIWLTNIRTSTFARRYVTSDQCGLILLGIPLICLLLQIRKKHFFWFCCHFVVVVAVNVVVVAAPVVIIIAIISAYSYSGHVTTGSSSNALQDLCYAYSFLNIFRVLPESNY